MKYENFISMTMAHPHFSPWKILIKQEEFFLFFIGHTFPLLYIPINETGAKVIWLRINPLDGIYCTFCSNKIDMESIIYFIISFIIFFGHRNLFQPNNLEASQNFHHHMLVYEPKQPSILL